MTTLVAVYGCESCDYNTHDHNAAEAHRANCGHWEECETCDRLFSTRAACEQHMAAVGHWQSLIVNYSCNACKERGKYDHLYDTTENLDQHLSTFCHDCDRVFHSSANFQAHMNSRTHQGTTIGCPFCDNVFVTPSGLSHHLEYGIRRRAPNLDRSSIQRVVHERHIGDQIVKKPVIWHEGEPRTFEAPARAFDGLWWRCRLCAHYFGSQIALNQHMNSLVHVEKMWRCPNKECGKNFGTKGAMSGHLESENCTFIKFGKFQQLAQAVAPGNRIITPG